MRVTTRFMAIAAASLLAVSMTAEAFAKPGRGSSAGSRGTRTDMSVPATPTAPRMQTPATGAPAAMAPRTGPAAPAAAPSTASTMMKGFAAGLIGAGLFGLLFGGGLFGGLSGLMGFLGLLLQVALIVIVARLIWGFFKSRQAQPAVAGAAPNPLDRLALNRGPEPQQSVPVPSTPSAQPASQERAASDSVGIGPDDYAAFQGTLVQLMSAYGREDQAAIRSLTTPDVAGHFIGELEDNQRRGLRNQLGEPTLLQGDLAEAWYEDQVAWATVAMRFAMVDGLVERATGNLVAGDLKAPSESTEIWTFRRDGMGRPWILAGIQQV